MDVSGGVSGDYIFYVDLEDVGGVVSGEVLEFIGSGGGSVRLEVPVYLLSGRSQFNYTLRISDVWVDSSILQIPSVRI